MRHDPASAALVVMLRGLIQHGRGDVATHPAARDPRDGPGAGPGGCKGRDIYVPDLRIGSGIKVPTRDFR